MADFSLLQTPNFMQSALSGYAAGQQIGRQNRLDAALGAVDLTRPETIMPVLQADPGTGTALLSASSQMAKARQDAATKAASSAGIMSALGISDNGSGAPAPQAIPHMVDASGQAGAAGALATPGQPGDIVVTGPRQGPTPQEQARVDWIKADPEGYIKTQTAIAGMTKAQREQTDSAMNTFGAAIEATKGMPYEQRRNYIMAQRGQLIAHGVDPHQIDAFDPTDANIQGIEGQVLGVKGLLERQDKDRTFALDQQKFSETQHHNRVDESQAGARIGLEAQSVGIAGGHLALDRQKEGREAAQAAAKQSPAAAGMPAPATRAAYAALPKGTTYRAPDGSIRIK